MCLILMVKFQHLVSDRQGRIVVRLSLFLFLPLSVAYTHLLLPVDRSHLLVAHQPFCFRYAYRSLGGRFMSTCTSSYHAVFHPWSLLPFDAVAFFLSVSGGLFCSLSTWTERALPSPACPRANMAGTGAQKQITMANGCPPTTI